MTLFCSNLLLKLKIQFQNSILDCDTVESSSSSSTSDVILVFLYLVHGFIAGSLNAEVDHGVGEAPAHVELQGEVVHTLGVLLIVVLLSPDPPRHQVILHCVGQREIIISETEDN